MVRQIEFLEQRIVELEQQRAGILIGAGIGLLALVLAALT